MLFYVLQGAGYALSATFTPGPFKAFLLGQALKHGFRRAAALALCPLLSDAPIIVLVLAILSQMPPRLIDALHLIGGTFLLYTAYRFFQIFRAGKSTQAAEAPPGRGMLWQGVLVNFTGPGPWIFWSTLIGPILLRAWAESPALGIAFVVAFYATFIAGLAGVIGLFSMARRLGTGFTRWLTLVSALLMLGFGLSELAAGVGAFV